MRLLAKHFFCSFMFCSSDPSWPSVFLFSLLPSTGALITVLLNPHEGGVDLELGEFSALCTKSETLCADDPRFKDEFGYSCLDWAADLTVNGNAPCHAAEYALAASEGFAEEEVAAIRLACPVACGVCRPGATDVGRSKQAESSNAEAGWETKLTAIVLPQLLINVGCRVLRSDQCVDWEGAPSWKFYSAKGRRLQNCKASDGDSIFAVPSHRLFMHPFGAEGDKISLDHLESPTGARNEQFAIKVLTPFLLQRYSHCAGVYFFVSSCFHVA